MKIISIVGKRSSGKTHTALDLANQLADQGFDVRVAFEGPEDYARSMTRLLHYGAKRIVKTGHEDKGLCCDYLIYDGYFHPKSSAKYDLSPVITEETYERLKLS